MQQRLNCWQALSVRHFKHHQQNETELLDWSHLLYKSRKNMAEKRLTQKEVLFLEAIVFRKTSFF